MFVCEEIFRGWEKNIEMDKVNNFWSLYMVGNNLVFISWSEKNRIYGVLSKVFRRDCFRINR